MIHTKDLSTDSKSGNYKSRDREKLHQGEMAIASGPINYIQKRNKIKTA